MQRTDEEADKSDGNPQDKQDNGARIDAARVVSTRFTILKGHIEFGFANEEIIRNHDAADRTKQSRITNKPA
jgi:hypothetical protein